VLVSGIEHWSASRLSQKFHFFKPELGFEPKTSCSQCAASSIEPLWLEGNAQMLVYILKTIFAVLFLKDK
jgi:hypothetical protein